ncbi:DUF397 domain-containing protein [Streptomyces sp. PT12]|uniref:DUF397 domain-containing protein n=1 Tax=Streptomyces sp. PT12 TaxID=1510197 RepID=UPI000DE21376|nr:DUF397 domain-containing protein [Streptomyces sp. PT12]RBM13814.1 DUF397 domain-containing protein [Streptomyces sp. PT12]
MQRGATESRWRTSSYSSPQGGECVEVRDGVPGAVPVRDTKQRGTGPVLTIGHNAWQAFINMAKL